VRVTKNENTVAIWLASSEARDTDARVLLREEIETWRQRGNNVAVYISGKGDLFADTLELLRHNRHLSARETAEI
jgi:hypothetical protein